MRFNNSIKNALKWGVIKSKSSAALPVCTLLIQMTRTRTGFNVVRGRYILGC